MKTNKTFTKIFAIAGAILLTAGIALFIAGMTAAGWDFAALNTVRYIQKEYALEKGDAVTSLTVHYESADIDVVYDENADAVLLSYPVRTDADGNENAEIEIAYTAGALTVEEKPNGPADLFQWNLSSPVLTITLPADTACALDIEAENGTLSLKGTQIIQAPSLALRAANGALRLAPEQGVSVEGDVLLSSQNGTVFAEGIEAAGTISLQNAMGNIEAKELTARSVTASLDTGNILLEDVRCTEALTAENGIGNVTLRGNIRAQKADLTTDTGGIAVDAGGVLDAQEISLTSDLGDISVRGALAGAREDYTFFIDTGIGNSDIPSGGSGARRLTARTETGNISLRFER